jgi:multiple sugar transport system ATP-binding protein
MGELKLENIEKHYGTFHAVKDLNIEVADGEFLVLVGPSGCGKSTALRMIAGLEAISGGTLRIDGEVMNTVRSKDRDIAMVFQNYALYPHMTIYDNIAFSLQVQKYDKAEIKTRVSETARVLQLEPHLKKRPGQLSGGQRQRVAMGRAIVRRPKIFLMDEPLSNLDAKLRVQMRAEIASLQHRLGVTTVYVTHDQVEAMTMGDRVAVLKDGVLQQVDTPSVIYDRPVNTFVATFIGSPSMALFFADLETNASGGTVTIGGQSLSVPVESFVSRPKLREYDGKRIIVGIRPENLSDPSLSGVDNTLQGDINLKESLGSDIMVHFTIEAIQAEVVSPDTLESLPDSSQSGQANCIARLSPRSQVPDSGTFKFGIDVEHMHYFDADIGEAIY